MRSPRTLLANTHRFALACIFASSQLFILHNEVFAANSNSVQPRDSIARKELLLDFGWKFHLGDAADPSKDFGYGTGSAFAKAGEAVGAARPDFNDSSWRIVDIPHDWAVEQPFVQSNDENVLQHGFKPIGRQFPSTTVGWYRRTFVVPASAAGKRFLVKFDGVFRNCLIWFNGHYIGSNFSGYSEFSFDLTDYVWSGTRNVLVVRVDASNNEGWFYEGAGIYRHTWLIEYAPMHIPLYGVFVHSEVKRHSATVTVSTDVFNQAYIAASCAVQSTIFDSDGHPIAGTTTKSFHLRDYERQSIQQELSVTNPRLWSIENPNLYSLVSLVKVGQNVIDSVRTTFGIRTVTFDKDKGFLLNGRRVEIKGTCNHQDHAGVGSALPDQLQYYRIERLKEMGCNAYRTSHNPPTPELLDACDRLGMLVMDENRLMGSSPELLGEFSTLVKRDRNHPSVIIWSLGNEEWVIQDDATGKNLALSLMQKLRELDPTRTCTYAANNGNHFEGINSVIPVRGFNYMSISDIDKYRSDHPDQKLWGSEEASTLCTRGIYVNDTMRGYVCDYDSMKPRWGALAEPWWKFYAAREWLAGAFVWTGFDYRGEPTPYGWPCINSHFGIMDVCGFPKNNFYYYQSWWSQNNVLHIFPHWNWPGKEGQLINVWCYSNCDEVELFLNGRSLGKKMMERNSHLEWKVPYEPGTLEARGVRDGQILTAKEETTGAPTTIQLSPDRDEILADGEDVSVVNVSVLDALGREVPTADNKIQFEVAGSGKAIGVGNGDPSSHEADKYLNGGWQRSLFNGKCQLIVQSIRLPGKIEIRASSDGLTTKTFLITVKEGRVEPTPESDNS